MGSWLDRRRAARQDRDDARVIGALWVAGALSGWPLTQATGLGAARVYVALERLQRKHWVVTFAPSHGTDPRRRLWALAGGGAPR